MLTTALLLAHAGATLFMAGVIWYVQVVHYPLMDRVDRADFPEFEAAHRRRTSLVVVPAMLIELAAVLALLALRPVGLPSWLLWAAAGLLGVIWASTFAIQVPCHDALLRGYDPGTHSRLVRSNWIRTAGWTLRAVAALWMILQVGLSPG